MRFGVIITDDDHLRGGEEGVGRYFIERFTKRNNFYNDEFIPIYAISGKLPSRNEITNYDGFIVTGSQYSVNEDKQWIRRLEVLIRQIYYVARKYNKIRMYGMCFGHQLIARSLGGKVGRNVDNKFHFGSVKVCIKKDFTKEPYMGKDFQNRQYLKMMKLHGECVIEVPSMAQCVGTSEHCENEMLKYGENILTSQGHPEYTQDEMVKTNAVVVSRHIDVSEIESRLMQLEIEDVDSLTEMVRSFLRYDQNMDQNIRL